MNYWERYADYAQLIRKFEHPVDVYTDESPFDFEGMAPPAFYGDENHEADYGKIAEHYGLKKPDNVELVSVLRNLESVVKGSNQMCLARVTSVDIAADKKGLISIPHLALIGAMHTLEDNRLIIGIRGRRYGQDLTEDRIRQQADNCPALTPGGACTFVYNGSPFDYTLTHESFEENGLTSDKLLNPEIISVFEVPKTKQLIGPSGLKVVSYFQVQLHSDDVLDIHDSALKKYRQLCEDGKSRKEVEQTLISQELPKDAWEHSTLETIDFNREAILDYIDKIPRDENNIFNHRLCGIGVGALLSVADYLNRQ